MGLNNRTVDTGGKSEIVRIDDEPAQAASLAGSWKASLSRMSAPDFRDGPHVLVGVFRRAIEESVSVRGGF